MELINKIETILAEAKTDAAKFYQSGNGAAGKRLRAKMLEIKNLTSDVRKSVSAEKNK